MPELTDGAREELRPLATAFDAGKVASVLNDPSHAEMARVAAERAAVLLRNEAGVPPLDARPVGLQTKQTVLHEHSGRPFERIEGAQPPKPPLDETAEIRRATELVRGADATVLVIGEGQDMIGEMASRSSLDLPGRQQELLDALVATGKPVIALLMNARPLDLKDAKPAAILEIWYPGT